MSVYSKDDPAHFEEALGSLLLQTYRDLTVFLMVDGLIESKLESVIERTCGDPRVIVQRSSVNRGLATSLNALIEEVLPGPYEFVARMDADDIAEPNRLARQIEFLRTHQDVDVLGTACLEIDEHAKSICLKRLPTTDAELKRRMLVRCPFVHPTVIFRRRVFESGIRYQTTTHLTEDMFLWVDLALEGRVFANLPEALLKYRVGPGFYRRRSGLRKAVAEYRAKKYIAKRLGAGGLNSAVVPISAFALRMCPELLLQLAYRYLR
jgi:glycosyltransferase involved in cell wall biosynthesis